MDILKKVAIIGSGFSGAYLANALNSKYEVYVFEKARGLGGRTASKRQGETSFDYGVSYFTIQDSNLKSFLVDPLFYENIELFDRKIIKLDRNDKNNSENQNVESRSEALFVSKPYGNSFAKALLKDVGNIFLETKICGVVKENVGNLVESRSLNDSKYRLVLENAVEFDMDFDIVISTAPAPQTAQIYAEYDDLVKSLSTMKYNPAFVLMLSLKHSVKLLSAKVSDTLAQIWSADILKIKNSIIEEIIFNHRKPLRDSNVSAFVIKASKSFTEANLDMEYYLVEELLLNEFFSIMGFDLESNVKPEIDFKHLHRWLYSTPVNRECKDLVNVDFLEDAGCETLKEAPEIFLKAKDEELYAVGDYTSGSSLEFMGGRNAFEQTDTEISGAKGVEASLFSAQALAQILNLS